VLAEVDFFIDAQGRGEFPLPVLSQIKPQAPLLVVPFRQFKKKKIKKKEKKKKITRPRFREASTHRVDYDLQFRR